MKTELKPPQAPAQPPAPDSPTPPPLFRRVDWLTFLLTTAAVWLGYYLTLAPEVTLEDSGELATGSYYAGIPHAPGYPVWTIYTWLWTVLLPFKNVAWRVALGEATAGALAGGLLGLLVSRGSSLLCESIPSLKAVPRRWQSLTCLVSGFSAGLLLGYNGFMWSQSVIVEVYSFSVLSFMLVLVCLLRWLYTPGQRRFLYCSLFVFGLCFTNHQTLIVAAMGLEVAIAAADARLGRNLFLGNTIVYFCGWVLSAEHILTTLEANHAVLNMFHIVGVCSLAAYIWFAWLTRETPWELGRDGCYVACWVPLAALPVLGSWGVVIAVGALAGFVLLAWRTRRPGLEWLVVLICGLCWLAGAAFYFYMPLACMTNPPMEWAYPRTVDGFIHAITRGQYEATHPTDIFHHPLIFAAQLANLGRGIIEEFNWVYAFLALIPFLFFFKLPRRERAWLAGLAAIYFCLGIILLILLNPPPDRGAQQLVRVFFTASHTVIALCVGYGLALVAANMAARYQRFRWWGLLGGAAALLLALFSFVELTHDTYFGEGPNEHLPAVLLWLSPVVEFVRDLPDVLSLLGPAFTNPNQHGLPIFAGLLLVGLTLLFLGAVWRRRQRPPLALTLALFALMPLHSILTHWADNEQRNHWFGYWFGHDMFSPPFKGPEGQPLYRPMTPNAILFGGTDPGRFVPTYMIFCESFIPHRRQPAQDQQFDRRDVYIITQNALADPPYLNYLRAQYNRSQQFDPPFFQELARALLRDEPSQTNRLARAVLPLDRFFTHLGDRVEKRRRTYTSWFAEPDILDLPAFAARLCPGPRQDSLSRFIYDQLSPATRELFGAQAPARPGRDARATAAALRRALVVDLNRLLERELEAGRSLAAKRAELERLEASGPERARRGEDKLREEIAELAAVPSLYEPARFASARVSDSLADFIKENPQGDTRIRLNRLLLEAAYPRELAKSLGGVYPDREIRIPLAAEAQQLSQAYIADAVQRKARGQLDPGEDVIVGPDGRAQINSQVSIMAINGLLTKVVFDQNPKNEFFVEESMAIKWMYPYLTPFGIIMKLNRQPPAELGEEVVRRDHEFWRRYAERLIGDWITYDTKIEEIVAWAERVYQRRDFTGFKGDRRFIRDDQAQKSFSKLRSSIAGIYDYRIRAARSVPEQQRMVRETDFALRQAFALCPYSLDMLARYVQFLANQHRFDDALLVANTCLKLDPNNGQIVSIVKNVQTWKAQATAPAAVDVESTLGTDPTNFQAAFNFAGACLLQHQTNRALVVLDRVLNNPRLNADAAFVLAQAFAQIGDLPRLQAALLQWVRLAPESPEAWYNLASFKAFSGNSIAALDDLRRALQFNAQRLERDPKAPDLSLQIQHDPRFTNALQQPEFRQLLGPGTNAAPR